MNNPGRFQLSPQDGAIWRAVDVCRALENGHLDEVPRVPSMVRLPGGEGALAEGSFHLQQLVDMQYEYQGGAGGPDFFNFVDMGDGRALRNAAAYSLGAAVGGHLVRRHREKKAEKMSGPKWVDAARGQLWLAPSSFTFRCPTGNFCWYLNGIENAQIMSPGRVVFEVSYDDGSRETFQLISDWALLAFVLWAHSQFPNHAQFAERRWVPSIWYQRMQQAGYQIEPPRH